MNVQKMSKGASYLEDPVEWRERNAKDSHSAWAQRHPEQGRVKVNEILLPNSVLLSDRMCQKTYAILGFNRQVNPADNLL